MSQSHYFLRLFYTICINLAMIAPVFSQSWQWAKRVGSPGDNFNSDDEAFSEVKVDKVGNVYATGTFYSSTYFQNAQLFGFPTPLGFGQGEAYLMKFNSCGSLLWYRRMGGSNVDGSTSLIIDKAGHLLVLGYSFSSPSYFAGGAGSTTLTSSNGSQFLARYDTAGTLLNLYTYPSYYTKIFLRSQGDYMLTDRLTAAIVNTIGIVTSTISFFPSPPPSNIFAMNDMKLDRNDNIYLCGGFNSTVVIAPGTTLMPTPSTLIPNTNAGNSLIMKLNSNGVLQWYQRGYSQVSDGLSTLALDTSESKILTSGRAWNNSVVFSYSVTSNIGTTSSVIYRLNASNGTFVSAITGTCNGAAIADVYAADRDNNFIMGGNLSGYMIMGSDTVTASGGGPNRQSFYGMLDSTGTLINMSLLPQTGSNSVKEKILNVAISEQGNVYFCGMFGGTLDSLGVAVPKLSGLQDGFVGKFGFPCNSTLTSLSPLASTNLNALYQGTLTNFINWMDNSNYETGFELWYHDASPTFSLLAILPANTTTYSHPGLSFNTNYCYKVRALNNIGYSAFTNTGCVTTPIQTVPQSPSSLTASNSGLINNIAWIDNSFDETSYQLWYHDASPTFSLLATLPANSTSYLHSGLNYTTTYCYRALAVNSVGPSVYTNTDCATTPQTLPPSPPSTLAAVNTGSFSNNVVWLDNSNNETSFELWYEAASQGYSLLATLPANTTSYNHIGLTDTTTYCYKVSAVNAGGSSAFTNIDCATTPLHLDSLATVGLQELSRSEYKIYPNPSKGILYVQLPPLDGQIDISIIDAVGRLVKEQRFSKNAETVTQKIILSVDKGLYFVQIRCGLAIRTEKVVID